MSGWVAFWIGLFSAVVFLYLIAAWEERRIVDQKIKSKELELKIAEHNRKVEKETNNE